MEVLRKGTVSVEFREGESPETLRKLRLCTKTPHQEIRWNCHILGSVFDLSCREPIIQFENNLLLSFFLSLLHVVNPVRKDRQVHQAQYLFISFHVLKNIREMFKLTVVFFLYLESSSIVWDHSISERFW